MYIYNAICKVRIYIALVVIMIIMKNGLLASLNIHITVVYIFAG